MTLMVVWTTGVCGEWRRLVRATVVPGVERSEAFILDVKEGRQGGRRNGAKGREGPWPG